ncbi:MAG: endonuclease III domain-containing protein [Planctomycetota bacterium]
MAMYDAMLAHFGPQGWWPGEGSLEICVGAILTQNTNWGNVERAIANLRAEGAMDVAAMLDRPVNELAELIRPAGYFNVKARRLRCFIQAVADESDGDIVTFLTAPSAETLREKLLAIHGIGPETADSMTLYAAGLATFVVDAYTMRIGQRHGLFPERTTYEDVRELFQRSLPTDVPLWNEYHALLVATGKHFCKPTPRCEGCPLVRFPRPGVDCKSRN